MSEEVRWNLNKLERGSEAYGEFLLDLVDNKPKSSNLILDIYESLFESPNWYLREVAVYSLLFKLKKRNIKYINYGFKYLFDDQEDEEVRVWSITGLASILAWDELTKEQQQGILKIIEDKSSELTVKDACLRGALKMLGITAREVFLKTFDDSNTELQFEFERKKKFFLKELKSNQQ